MQKTILFLMLALFSFGASFRSTAVFGQSAGSAKDELARSFQWPNGKRMALSLSFDDGRLSQVDTGLALLRNRGVRVTFFLLGNRIEKRLEGWRQAVADGHEIGNHYLTHPCTANYEFSRHTALEAYSLSMIEKQLDSANAEISRLLGIKPETFAYPCGQKFVGRGRNAKSYVPLIAKRFLVGRGYLDEAANDPAFCDLAQTLGTPFDDMSFEQVIKPIEEAAKQGRWLIFVRQE